MVNFLQQRDDLYFSHPTITLISILPAEDNIEAMLDRDAAAAAEEEAERGGSFTGAAAEPDHVTKNKKDENYRSVPEVERDGSFARAAEEPDYIVTKDSRA